MGPVLHWGGGSLVADDTVFTEGLTVSKIMSERLAGRDMLPQPRPISR